MPNDRYEKLALRVLELTEALKESGDVIQCYHLNTGIDLGDASAMPFYSNTMLKIDTALRRTPLKAVSYTHLTLPTNREV